MKINDLLQIESIDTLCCGNFSDKTKYIWYQNFVLIYESYFWTEYWPSFSIHTAAVKELVYKVYLHLEYNFYHACRQKEKDAIWMILQDGVGIQSDQKIVVNFLCLTTLVPSSG